MVEESKSALGDYGDDGNDGDGDVPQPPCYITRMPEDLWNKVVLCLAWQDAAAIHTTSKGVRDATARKWSPDLTISVERAALEAQARAHRLGGGEMPAGGVVMRTPLATTKFKVVMEVRLANKGLGGAWRA